MNTKDDDGNTVSITQRCADMDNQVPLLMGVSPAVIENVIFCHQEDSNWPLGEDKKVKEKFDDIFDSTRYTKALEVIRKLRSEKVGTGSDRRYHRGIPFKELHLSNNL